MSHNPALSCLVASGGGNVIGGWVLQLQAKAPLLCCRVASTLQGATGTLCEATEVSRGQGGTTVLLSGLGPLLVILSVPCGPAYAKPHDHFYPMTADLSVMITEWMSPVHQDWRSLLYQTQDRISSRLKMIGFPHYKWRGHASDPVGLACDALIRMLQAVPW